MNRHARMVVQPDRPLPPPRGAVQTVTSLSGRPPQVTTAAKSRPATGLGIGCVETGSELLMRLVDVRHYVPGIACAPTMSAPGAIDDGALLWWYGVTAIRTVVFVSGHSDGRIGTCRKKSEPDIHMCPIGESQPSCPSRLGCSLRTPLQLSTSMRRSVPRSNCGVGRRNPQSSMPVDSPHPSSFCRCSAAEQHPPWVLFSWSHK